jgi:phosphoribosylaminoimidazole-succinocarboxamide synthase
MSQSLSRGTAGLERGALLYDGKAKQVFETADPGLVWIHFKDEATAFNGVKKAVIRDKGEVNARISAHIYGQLEAAGVHTHLVDVKTPRDHICTRVEIIPVEVVVRNVIAGSCAKRFGFEEGAPLPRPMVEWFYKSDELNDPPMSDEHALMFGWAEPWELAYLRHAGLKVNEFLKGFWSEMGVTLVDFKLEFGRAADGRILLADEITPDGSRLWEEGTGRRFDKDVFRRDLGDLGDTYRDLFSRVFGEGLHDTSPTV